MTTYEHIKAIYEKMWNKFENGNLSFEKILTNFQDSCGKLTIVYGQLDNERFKTEHNGDEIAEPFYIDIQDESYFYDNGKEWTKDMKKLIKLIMKRAFEDGYCVYFHSKAVSVCIKGKYISYSNQVTEKTVEFNRLGHDELITQPLTEEIALQILKIMK